MRTIKFKQLLSDDEKIILGIHGRFAYLINELEDYVTAFEYSNGTLKHLSSEIAYEGGGHGSADIHVSPDDNRIEVYSIDSESGALTYTGKSIEIPAPVCIQLYRLHP